MVSKSIFGLETGLGKTTLARRVYDSEAVRVHFPKGVWICVSENFTAKRLLNEMVESLNGRTGMSNAEAIKRELHKELEGQRYLLVLDDVWDKDHGRWEPLLSSLYEIGGSSGTRVLVTARNHEVVKTVQPLAVHTLKKLSEEESWALFQQIVFRNEPTGDASDLVVIGKRIVEKCKGVPLAIKMLGGLLRSKKNAHEWKLIERSEIWELPQDEFGILPSLLLSFYYLPSPVKQCFSYCAIFPKGAVMRRNDLIRLWLAQGFLHVPGRNISPEDIGEVYFNMLLNNWFLLSLEDKQLSLPDEYLSPADKLDELGMDMKCTMHDLVHDMAIFVSKTDCLIWKVKNKLDEVSNVRHLALLHDNLDADYEFVANGKLGKLRTVHSQIRINNNLLLNASNLRVLKLSRIGLWEIPSLREIPTSISCLKHCRYLDLSGHHDIHSLPDSITELYNLQTLQLEGCGGLHKFPEGMSKLVNLRHLPTWIYMEMPTGMKDLTQLQTLPMLSLRESGSCTIDEIGCLDDVKGGLRIEGLEFVASKDAAIKARIDRKTEIVYLELRWDVEKYTGTSSSIEKVKDGSTDEDVLDGLRPHPNLKRLDLVGYEGKEFAPWLKTMTVFDETGNEASLNNLVELRLSNCNNCEKLPTLGQWTNLERLSVSHCKKLTSLPEGLECLHRLRALEIGGFPEGVEYFPDVSKLADLKSLTFLSLQGWPNLKSLPDKVGLLTSLERLYISKFSGIEVPEWIGNLSSLVGLTVDKWPNLKHLPSQTTMLRLKRLRSINLCGCPHMIENCDKGVGPEWHKISHVPYIYILAESIFGTPYFA